MASNEVKERMPDNDMLTPAEVARVLRVTRRAVYTYLLTGQLKGYKVGGGKRWVIRREDLDAFLIPGQEAKQRK